jgi:hypothetical protein
MSDIDPFDYLAALDDARAERAALYPSAVDRAPERTAVEVEEIDRRRRLPPATCELGLRKLAEIRAQLEERRARSSRPGRW